MAGTGEMEVSKGIWRGGSRLEGLWTTSRVRWSRLSLKQISNFDELTLRTELRFIAVQRSMLC